ncbi:hypothetical protein ADUPG1_000390 [Aduncisulcus paluster]|uniref:SF-assemblin n=1 Tax=Aduncisulcus paluster TaxID=2918883 RepID=A0ABQ5K832_9EUKA|nr:hypothetical protein ADUPG1_000390 [Aduncisulcus paluster]
MEGRRTPKAMSGVAHGKTPANRATPQSSYFQSPTLQRLSLLQGRCAAREGRPGEEGGDGSKISQAISAVGSVTKDDMEKISERLISATKQVKDQKRVIESQQTKIDELTEAVSQLQVAMRSEDATRKSLNTTFARNFAMKVESRFLKLESAINAQSRTLAQAESDRVRMLHEIDKRLSDFADRLDSIKVATEGVISQHSALNSLCSERFGDLDALVKETHDTSREESLWAQLKKALAEQRKQLEEEQTERAKLDAERQKQIEEGLTFIREGKDTWMRYFDYKLLPFKMAREDAETKLTNKIDEIGEEVKKALTLSEDAQSSISAERRERVDVIASIERMMSQEKGEREAAEEQISGVLEHVLSSLDGQEEKFKFHQRKQRDYE